VTESTRPPFQVAVVGGGYAGLAAAYRLARSGVRVSLFERSGHLGGLGMSFPLGDTEIEKYYHHWFTSDHDILDLIAEMGLADKLRWPSPVMGTFCQGRIYRFTSPMDLLRFRPLSLPAKLRFGVVTLFLQRYPHRQRFEGKRASEWLRRYAGREVYETIWGPLLRAKFGRHAEAISMAWIWSKMRLRGTSRTGAGNKESLGYIDGGFGVVARRIAEEIVARGGSVHTAEPVLRINPIPKTAESAAGFELETHWRRPRFDAVISTVAPPLLARLVPALPEDYRRRCEDVEHSAILCTMLLLRQQFSSIYWMNVADPEVPFGGLIEHTNFIPPERYGGRRILYISHYLYRDEATYGFDARTLFEHYEPGLRRIQPRFDPSWVERQLEFRDDFAQPIVTVDYHLRLLPLAAPLPGLYVATMAQVYPEDRGTNYAVRIGTRAAQALGTLHGLSGFAEAHPGKPDKPCNVPNLASDR
jgi:protoporphyrinogen oxidase